MVYVEVKRDKWLREHPNERLKDVTGLLDLVCEEPDPEVTRNDGSFQPANLRRQLINAQGKFQHIEYI